MRKLKDKEALDKTKQNKKIQRHRLIELNSHLCVNAKEINKVLEEIIQKKEYDFSHALTLYNHHIQWFDEIIKSLNEDPIKHEFNFLQYYLLSRELSISWREFFQCLDSRVRFGIDEEKRIEELMNQCNLINEILDNLFCSEKNNQKPMGFQVSEILLNAIRQSISIRNKELLN